LNNEDSSLQPGGATVPDIGHVEGDPADPLVKKVNEHLDAFAEWCDGK